MRLLKIIIKIIAFGLFLGAIYISFMVYSKLVVTERTIIEIPGTEFNIDSIEKWEEEKNELLSQLEENEYGLVPTTEIAWNVQKRTLDDTAFSNRATYELWQLTAPDNSFTLTIVALIPNSESPVPLVVVSNFCPTHLRYPEFSIPAPAHYPGMCGSNGAAGFMVNNIFGEYIETFPFEMFIENNFALANIYLAEGVPDDMQYAPEALKTVSTLTETNVTGALAAWAWEYIETIRIFEQDERIDASKTAVYGHSRDGKAALLAGAFSDKVDLVLAHQSGKGGAALWGRGIGEPIDAIISSYSYWFSPNFAQYRGRDGDLPFDQHHLLAAIAPRPVLLSSAWLDKWGDPAGVLTAASLATPVYELYGARGIESNRLDTFEPAHELAFFIRSWTHGVRESDWNAFFQFMNEQFSAEKEN